LEQSHKPLIVLIVLDIDFAYPSSYGDINSLTYASSILNSISAFKRASNDVVITTLSGLTRVIDEACARKNASNKRLLDQLSLSTV
jgi:hypothetical protein